MKLLAGLDVTTKAIERAGEAIGTQIAQRDEQEISRAKQLVLPVVSKRNIPIMYVLMDGIQVPVMAAETEGRAGRIEGQRARTRECKLGCVFTQTTVDKEGWPIRDLDSTTYVGAIETAEKFGFRIYAEAWRRGWEWATIKVFIGDGAIWTWNLADSIFPAPFRSWTSIMPGSIYGVWPLCSTAMIRRPRNAGWFPCRTCWMPAALKFS